MDYPVLARSYLHRARLALEQDTPPSLFYAAFELRCCVEARQAEYAEALKALEGTKIRPWNVGETGKRIKKNSINSSITLVRLVFPDGSRYSTYHTPVTDELIGFVERDLNPLLHCQTVYRSSDNAWWESTKAKLIEGYRMAWLACQGDSMTPPLGNIDTGKMHPFIIETRDDNGHVLELVQRYLDQPMQFEVRYPDMPPEQWICDL